MKFSPLKRDLLLNWILSWKLSQEMFQQIIITFGKALSSNSDVDVYIDVGIVDIGQVMEN